MKQITLTNRHYTFSFFKNGMVLLCMAFTLLTSGSVYAQKVQAGNYYMITGNGLSDTSYLFGTYHLVNSGYLEELPVVQHSFAGAKGVVVEIVMDSTKLPLIQSAGMMKDKTLTELLDQPFRDSLSAELQQSLGVGIEPLNRLKPMNVTLTLSMVYTMKNNRQLLQQYKGEPLDAYFAATGKRTGKKVTALETIEGQMDLLFNSQAIDQQVEGLKAFIRNKKQMEHFGDELLKAWFGHDLTRMISLYEKTLQLAGEEDYLIKERNLNWMKVLPEIIQKQSTFIAVGALHLGGEWGLVKQLQQLGFTVTAVKL
jgi:uncharacterized protein YbaP (TraB family)